MRRISEREPADVGRRRSCPTGDPIAPPRASAQPPRVGRQGAAGGPPRPRRRHRRRRRRRPRRPCSRPTTRRPRCPSSPGPGWPTSTSCVGGRRRALGALPRSAPCSTDGDPGGIAAVRDGRAAVQDEGSQLLALALAAAEVADRRAGASAGSTCAPARAARPALLATLAAPSGADPRSPTRSASTAPTWSARPSRGADRRAASRSRSAPATAASSGEDEPGGLRPGARRRAVHRAGGAAPPARGALASHARRRGRRSAALQRALLTSAIDATRPGGVVGLRHVQPAPRRDPVRRRRRAQAARRRRASSTRGRCSPTPPGAPVPHLGEGPYVQLWPHVHGTDAMFLALLRKG